MHEFNFRKYVKIKEASKYLGISTKTFRKYLLNRLNTVKVGNTILVDLSELEQVLHVGDANIQVLLEKIQQKGIDTGKMKLWRKFDGIYYVRHGQKKISLRTRDLNEAKRLFNEIKRKYTGETLFSKIENNRTKGNSKKLSEILQEFLEIRRNTLSKSSYYRYQLVCNLFININGDKDINKYNFRDIEKFKSERLKSVNANTLNSDLMHLKSFFNFCKKSEYLTKDLASKVEFMKTEKKDRTLSYSEMQQIKQMLLNDYLQETKSKIIKLNKNTISTTYQLYVLYCIYVMSGRRRNEALNLTLDDIDLRQKTMRFYNQKAKKYSTIPLSSELFKILKKYIEQNREAILRNNNRLFTLSQATVNHRLKEYFVKINRSDVRVHDLRHSFATYLASQNVPIQVISSLLDHSDVKITMRYYHRQENTLREALENIKF